MWKKSTLICSYQFKLLQQIVVYVYFECHICQYTVRIVESAMTIAKNISYVSSVKLIADERNKEVTHVYPDYKKNNEIYQIHVLMIALNNTSWRELSL